MTIDHQTARPALTATSKPFNVHNLLHAINIMANVHALRDLGVRIAQRRYVALWPAVETGPQESDRHVNARRVGRASTATYARQMVHVTR